jgi:hypothetical protein
LWSWAFGASEDDKGKDASPVGAGNAGVPSLEAVAADLERLAEATGAGTNGAGDAEALAAARRAAADAKTRAEAAERALAERDRATATSESSAAQTAQAKRVAAAEGFAAELAGKLEASEKRVSELQWQVRMLAEPEGLKDAGAAEPPKGPGGWLAGAVKGCMAPRPGRGR